jgi:hypothetical protein
MREPMSEHCLSSSWARQVTVSKLKLLPKLSLQPTRASFAVSVG